jgi:hypothetical protein
MMQVPETLGSIEVLDENGAAHRIGELWRDHTAVILWVRHFG